MEAAELEIFKIIASSGDSRGAAFAALGLARKQDFVGAKEKLKEAKEKSLAAHEVQTHLITKETQGDKTEVSLLMVHAQDHLMSSMLARDLIEEMVGMLEEIYQKK
ncbi:PTS lactose/cellobiose transporter subunit IIA [Carnobacterium gallinarum]|uniref:PTS lactose/cellobiose transporter subunit IIA n=1 Tax=Carnobacterium gallinarum TaxID=2749 RepID=UPI00055111CD|nr:PTS lactose/cellobiose transporter subunit IIA [Carnobacterium gallinarum]